MARQTGINAPLYKIDVDAARDYFADKIEVQDFPARLVQEYNERKGEEIYASKGGTTVDGSYVELFINIKSTPNTSSWVRFFKHTTITFGQPSNQFQHLICFVVLGDDLYAFTAGQSAVVFERFVDLSFPIEVGRRIAKPEIKGARANQITGSTLASDLHFRDPRRITYTESLDTVWTALSGYLRDNKLGLKELTNIFGVKNKIKIDVTSALRLGPKVQDPVKMINLIKWFAEQEQEDLPEDDGWAALDAIKLLNPRKRGSMINKLRESLADKVFKDKDDENLALTHADIPLYTNATRYVVKHHNDVILYDGTVEPLLSDILKSAVIDVEYVKNFFAITIRAINEDYAPTYGTEGTLLAHLNGELTYEGKTYFLLAGKWYEVDATYIEQIKKDFVNLLAPLDVAASSIGLKDWQKDASEGDYNASSLNFAEHINGDTILTDNVELFDTLVYRDDKLYILHVKRGFNVKIRDVRSQLLASAQVIENDLRSSSKKLNNHYRQLVEKERTTLSEEGFLELFQRPRVYVLCYGTKDKVAATSIHKFRSSVAKMEVVSLNNQFRQIGTDDSAVLRIAWIPITD
ncbi:MAG: TIGR04141 family sporadically distributed protein [Actinomycetota bacterium]|nr:TIGR04141 family sporadically distributed protein [Actinomycetota bacterium]